MVTLRQIRQELNEKLRRAGFADPQSETLQMLCFVLGVSQTSLYANFEQTIDREVAARLHALADRRAEHEPLAYVLGEVWFSDLRFVIGPGALVPRTDSEVTVETARRLLLEKRETLGFPSQRTIQILDTCTGSGCIGLSLAHHLEQEGCLIQLSLVDLDDKALTWASRNAALLGLSDRTKINRGDLFSKEDEGPFDLIVANPPYIESDVIEALMPEISRFEPVIALDGGPDGLALYRRLAKESVSHLKPGGWLVVEHGFSQAESVSAILKKERYEVLPTYDDFGGRPRVCAGRLSRS